jgi:hypothetical protein
MLKVDRIVKLAAESALAEIDLSFQCFNLSKVDPKYAAEHLSNAHYAEAEASRHLELIADSEPASATSKPNLTDIEARLEKLRAEILEWELSQKSAG